MSFLLHNVIIYNNKIIIIYTNYKFHSLIELNGNCCPLHESPLVTSTVKHQVELRHCSISNNMGIGYIIKLFKLPQVLDIPTYMHLNIYGCNFSHNEVANTLMAMFNYFTVMSITNSRYVYNNVCDLSLIKEVVKQPDVRNAIVMPEEMCDGYKDILHSGEKSALFIICSDKVFFKGLNKFLFNSIFSSYFWIIPDHIILEENT